jgi:protein tyrosine phosphatase
MLTNFVECGRYKAHLYWPLNQSETELYGDIAVTLLSVADMKTFVVRHLQLSRDTTEIGRQCRQVCHVHYTEWPDFDTPLSTAGIRQLCKFVNNASAWENPLSTPFHAYARPHAGVPGGGGGGGGGFGCRGLAGPLVVHCSAGVGRSGSFIAIHHALRLLSEKQPANIMEITASMRRDRPGMVQTQSQYLFIYDAIRDHCQEQGLPLTTATAIATSTSSTHFNNNITGADSAILSSEQPIGVGAALVLHSKPNSGVRWRHLSSDGLNSNPLTAPMVHPTFA